MSISIKAHHREMRRDYKHHVMIWKILKRALNGFGVLFLFASAAIYFFVIREPPIPSGNPSHVWAAAKRVWKTTASAGVWPSPDVGDDFRNPVECKIPIVFVLGDWDMNTPIENTREVAPNFPNSHTLEVRQGGHDPIPSMMEENPEVFALLMKFAHTGATNELPEEIVFKPSKKYDPPKFKVKKSD